jgi:serine acetyltransferase
MTSQTLSKELPSLRSVLYGLRRTQLRLSGITVGPHTVVSPLARVRRNGSVSIGTRSLVGRFVELAPQGGSIVIGSNCSVNDFCIIYGAGGVTIGDNVRMATGAVVVASEHIYEDPSTPIRLQGAHLEPTTIEEDVWLGTRVTILAGVTIGAGTVVGAGAVVTHSLPPGVVAYGVPAKVIRARGEPAGEPLAPAE